MIPAQQPEYIITEQQLDEIFAFLQNPPMMDVPEFTLAIEQEIRSRPAPSPDDMKLSCCKDCPCETPHCKKNCRYYEVAQEAASAATLVVITELQTWLELQDLPLLKQKIWRKLESLRAGG